MANYFYVLFYLIDETCKNKQQEECINTLTRIIKNMIKRIKYFHLNNYILKISYIQCNYLKIIVPVQLHQSFCI